MDTKPGWKTTEFWLSLIAVLIGAVMASGILDSLGQDHWVVKLIGIVTSVLGALGYTAVRGFVKGSANKATAIKAAALKDPL